MDNEQLLMSAWAQVRAYKTAADVSMDYETGAAQRYTSSPGHARVTHHVMLGAD